MDKEKVKEKMHDMMQPVNHQLFLCQNGEEELRFACAMLQRITEIFDSQLGIEGRKKMFEDLV